MSVELSVTKRTGFGKYFSKSLRKKQMIPAVAYNKGTSALHFVLDSSEFSRLMPRIKSEKVVFLKGDDIHVKTVVKAVQWDPVSDLPTHVDFHVIEDGQKIRTKVLVELVNQNSCAALKSGGFLNLVKRKIEVYCDAEYLPKSLPIDVKNATIGASIRVSDFVFPENVQCLLDPYTTVITISGKKAAKTKEASEVATESAEGGAKSKEKADASSKPKKEEKKPKAAPKK